MKKQQTVKTTRFGCVELTDMEYLVYTTLKDSFTLEDAYCLHPEDIADESGIEMKKLRGVISSLIKKDVVYLEKWNGKDTWVFLWETPNTI